MKTLAAAVFMIALAASFSTADACQCGVYYPPPLEEFDACDAVFTGTVVLIEVSPTQPEFYDVHFVVNLYWKGALSVLQTVRTGVHGGSCGYAFDLNTEYLVYAVDDYSFGLLTDVCRRTRPTGPGAQEDLDALGPGIPVPVEEVTWGEVKSMYHE